MADFSKATLIDLFSYLENMEQEASVYGISTKDYLDKQRLVKKIPKDIFTILYNTINELEKGDLTVDGKTWQIEHEEESRPNNRLISSEEEIIMSNSKTSKELGAWIMDRNEWSVARVNSESGAEFNGSDNSDTFSYKVDNGLLTINDRKYTFKKDFDCLGYEKGNILVLRKWYDESLFEVVDEVLYNKDMESLSA